MTRDANFELLAFRDSVMYASSGRGLTPSAPNLLIFAILLLLLLALPATAQVKQEGGGYRALIATKPAQIGLGKSQLQILLTDTTGKPVAKARVTALTKMPTMDMGEKEVFATESKDTPGLYTASAAFAMEGRYSTRLHIEGEHGAVTLNISLETGQNTGSLPLAKGESSQSLPEEERGFALPAYFWWIGGGALGVFVLYRVFKAGQRPDWRVIFSRTTLGGVALLVVFAIGARYAVQIYRRPGSMTPIEAQGMQMELPAPEGTAPVELATVERGDVDETVRYTGQVVGFVEQDISARVSGTIQEMRVYPGDTVRRGQLLARLDVSQSLPQVDMQRAGADMAQQGIGVSQKEYQQSLAEIVQAKAEAKAKRSALESARADTLAAQEERGSAQASLNAVKTQAEDADAQLRAAQADQMYWKQEIARMAKLLRAGAVTQEEYQRELAMAQNADAKVRQAQARTAQVDAEIGGAQAALRKASAMIASAQAKRAQAQSDIQASEARVASSTAFSEVVGKRVLQARAGAKQAQAGLSGAMANLGYSEIRSTVDGVATQRVVSPGVLVNPGQVILRVAQVSPIRLQANVPEADLPRVHIGSRVLIRGHNSAEAPFEARISSMTPSLDSMAHTGIVEATVPNRDRRFLPGQFLAMEIVAKRKANALRIPMRAIRYRTPPSGDTISTQSVAYVLVAEPVSGRSGRYTIQEVVAGMGVSDGKNTEILSGLKAGQRVVCTGQDYLKNGDAVHEAERGEAK